MDSNKKKVIEYIENNFDIELVKIKDFPVLPGGTIVIDSNGDEILFYWDILRQKVVCR
jgi:phage-related protein